MNQNHYDQFNYDNYDARKKSIPAWFNGALKNPVYATAAILGAGVVLSGAIIIGNNAFKPKGEVPVVLADSADYKQMPEDIAAIDNPFSNSELYAGLRGDEDGVEMPPVEDLLSQELPVKRDVIMAEQRAVIDVEPAAGSNDGTLIEKATGVKSIPDAQGGDTLGAIKVEKTASEDLLKKIEPVANGAESSPETVEFVRNVLNPQEESADQKAAAAPVEPVVEAIEIKEVAKTAADVAPAAGFNATAGTHYVQLGSVKSADGAAAEWSKLQKKYPAQLGSVSYRVDRAELGDRGTFYRIQAGPISGESASAMCDAIKAQSPGACLVVK